MPGVNVLKLFLFVADAVAKRYPGNAYLRGRLSTVDLRVKITCFVKKYIFSLP